MAGWRDIWGEAGIDLGNGIIPFILQIAAFTHPSHIVIYVTGDSLICHCAAYCLTWHAGRRYRRPVLSAVLSPTSDNDKSLPFGTGKQTLLM